MPEKTPSVSVIIPVFNAGKTIRRAISSILSQTMQDFEIVVVDDGSTDETPLILRKMSRNDARIRVLQYPHQGIVKALDVGIDAVRAMFIARMDADDAAKPERFLEQLNFLKANPDIGLVGSMVEFAQEEENTKGYRLYVDWQNSLISQKDIMLNRFVESPFAHPSVMFRKSAVANYGAYREGDFPEDYELWLRWLDAGVIMAKIPRILLTWHDSPNRLSRSDPRYRAEAFYRCKARYIGRSLRKTVNRKLYVWGAGRTTRKRAEHLVAEGCRIEAYIDIDSAKNGRVYNGRPVINARNLPNPQEAFILTYVGSRGAREQIRARLSNTGWVEGRDFICCA